MFARLAVLSIALFAGFGCTSQPDTKGSEQRTACESACEDIYCLNAAERVECGNACIEETESNVTEYNRCARSASTCTQTRDCARDHLYVPLGEFNAAANNQPTQTNNQSNSQNSQSNNQTTQSNNHTTQTNNQTTQTNNETEPICGNGIVEGTEECDDGNDDETDSCVYCQDAEPDPECPVLTEKFCDGMCRDWVDNPEHCGECDNRCSFDICEGGVCVVPTFCKGNEDCPPDERCENNDGRFYCGEGDRGTLPYGTPCSSFNDCASGICLTYCTRACEYDSDCTELEGWECSDAEWCQMKF